MPATLTPVWSKAFGPGAEVWEIDADAAGNVMIAGRLYERVDFGNGPIGPDNWNRHAMFVASFDPAGQRRFAYSLYASRFHWQTGFSAHMDASGNVGVTGVALREVGAATIKYPCGSQSSNGEGVAFAARLDQNGDCSWVKTVAASGLPELRATVDDDGNTYLTGSQNVDGQNDVIGQFTSKVNEVGEEIWRIDDVTGDAIEVDQHGNVLLVKTYSEFDPGLCVVKLDAAGTQEWQTCYGNQWAGFYNGLPFSGLSVNYAGSYALGGHFTGVLTFGSQPLAAGAGQAMFVGGLDAGNQHLFSRRVLEVTSDSGGKNPAPIDSAISNDGRVAMVGGFWRTADFGVGEQQALGTGEDDTDAFVAVYDTSGTLTAFKQYGGAGADWIRAAHYDSSGALTVAGQFAHEIDLGDGAHAAPDSDSGLDNEWVFVARLSP